jgi:hypothetical protein
MNRSRPIACALALLGLLAIPAAAGAAIPPPPGNSAADQYTETFPGAGGNQTTSAATGGHPSRTLGSETAQEFRQAGPVGVAAAQAATATAPSRPGRAAEPTAGGSADDGGSGPLEVVRHGLGTSGSDGMGLLLPLLLAAILAAAAMYGYSRLRRTTLE